MKKLLLFPLLILAIVIAYSCQNDDIVPDEPNVTTAKATNNIRTIEEVIAIADQQNPTRSRSGESYEIEVITSETGKPQSRSGGNADTLFYFVKNIPHPLVIAANRRTYPILAEFDHVGTSLLDVYNNPSDINNAVRGMIELALQDTSFQEENGNMSRDLPADTTVIGPKLHDLWHQNFPLNLYCPPKSSGSGNCPVGCVALASFQAMTVTRHINYINGYHISWDMLHSVWCGGIGVNGANEWANRREYLDSLAHYLREVGRNIDMNYTDNVSYAYTDTAMNRLFKPDLTVSKSLNQIVPTLRDYDDGIIVINSNDGQNYGHCYVADGVRIISRLNGLFNTYQLHCNLGGGEGTTGYYTLTFGTLTGISSLLPNHVNFTFNSIHS
ncbi:MAG: C10 family peptidase [Muribaculaceae bacterium]|nr:C10 family peptidase [Muribaculaceae bacterium]